MPRFGLQTLFSLVYYKKILKKSHQPSTKYCQLKLEIQFLVRLFWGLEYSDFIQYWNKVMFFLFSVIKKREYFMLFSFIIFLPSSILIILFFSIPWRNSLLFKRISMLKKILAYHIFWYDKICKYFLLVVIFWKTFCIFT